MRPSKSPESFDLLYRRQKDPWRTFDSPYETEKAADAIGMLGSRHYRRAFEAGCGVGAMTGLLADRSDHVLAVDGSDAAVELARRHCARLPGVEVEVEVEQMLLPASLPPPDTYDLVVFSEIGYYLNAEDLAATATGLVDALVQGGDLLTVHWTGHHPDHRSTVAEVVEALTAGGRLAALRTRCAHRHGAAYRVDLFRKPVR